MYSIYKYNDILNLESSLSKHFSKLSPSKKIVICPPVLRKSGVGYVLAYLVIPEPEEVLHHIGVTRPIGAILRGPKSKHISKIITCDKHEFAFNHDSFEHEYYSLENRPELWPNRTRENEEKYKLALESLYQVVLNIKLIGGYNKAKYDSYKAQVKSLFPIGYHYFFGAIERNEIIPVNDELIAKREQSKLSYENEEIQRKKQLESETEEAYKIFLRETNDNVQLFVRKELLPSLKREKPYCLVDFYEYFGKTMKKIYVNRTDYIDCYTPTLTIKAKQLNQAKLQEQLKSSLVQTYSKARNKPLAGNDNANELSNLLLDMLHLLGLRQRKGDVNNKLRDDMQEFLRAYKETLKGTETAAAKNEFNNYFNMIYHDYYEATRVHELSELSLGYFIANNLTMQ